MAVIVRFNGTDLPTEMENLAPGEYILEAIGEETVLTAEEDAGIQAALTSLREGRGVDEADVRRRIEALLR